jgi:predicted negative regulator of RcsB-dependent stress response
MQHYQTLRTRYYGRAVYDFGDVALAELATKVRGEAHEDDALRLEELNVQQNPTSGFAKGQHAALAIAVAYQKDAVTGAKAYHDFKTQYGDKTVNEDMLNQIGYGLLGEKQADKAIPAFRLIADENPTSSNAFDSLGEAYLAHGDKKLAREAYKKSLALDPKNTDAQAKLDEIAGKKPKPKS